jgi:uncharacterized protein YndB with AHSA1/START domain
MQQIQQEIIINTAPADVWDALTQPAKMSLWMGEADMEIEVLTDWKVGNAIVIKGFHIVRFEGRGTSGEVEADG